MASCPLRTAHLWLKLHHVLGIGCCLCLRLRLRVVLRLPHELAIVRLWSRLGRGRCLAASLALLGLRLLLRRGLLVRRLLRLLLLLEEAMRLDLLLLPLLPLPQSTQGQAQKQPSGPLASSLPLPVRRWLSELTAHNDAVLLQLLFVSYQVSEGSQFPL